MYIAVMWAVSIHLVTAFLLAGLPARPFWNTALLGPRFLASAFTAGPAFVIVLLWFIRRETKYDIADGAFSKLALITTVAAQINLVMLISELFYKFYWPTQHGINARYLFFGLGQHHALVPWIWTAIALNVLATVALMIHPLRRNPHWLMLACVVLFVGDLDREGNRTRDSRASFPRRLARSSSTCPRWVELCVTAGIWALGLFVLTVLVRVALPIELGRCAVRTWRRRRPRGQSARAAPVRGEDDVRPVRTR